MCQVKIAQNNCANGPGETWQSSFNINPEGIWVSASWTMLNIFSDGDKINLVGKKPI